MRKKMISFLLSLVMVLSLIPAQFISAASIDLTTNQATYKEFSPALQADEDGLVSYRFKLTPQIGINSILTVGLVPTEFASMMTSSNVGTTLRDRAVPMGFEVRGDGNKDFRFLREGGADTIMSFTEGTTYIIEFVMNTAAQNNSGKYKINVYDSAGELLAGTAFRGFYGSTWADTVVADDIAAAGFRMRQDDAAGYTIANLDPADWDAEDPGDGGDGEEPTEPGDFTPAEDANNGFGIRSAQINEALNYPFDGVLRDGASLEFDVTPMAGAEGQITFSPLDRKVSNAAGAAGGVSLTGGKFILKDGNNFTLDTGITFVADQAYHFKFDFDVAARTYTVAIDGVSFGGNLAMRNPSGSNSGNGNAFDNIGQFNVYNTNNRSFLISNISTPVQGLVDNEVVVDEVNPVDNGDGTKTYYVGPSHNFKKIQDIINGANAFAAEDIIILEGGYSYPGPIVPRKGIQIFGQGTGDNRPKIVAGSVTNLIDLYTGNGTPNVLCVIDNVIVAGNFFDTCDSMGLAYDDPGFKDNARPLVGGGSLNYRGIYLNNGTTYITNSEVYGNYMGIHSGNSGRLVIDNCDVHHNGTDTQGHNIYIANDGNNTGEMATATIKNSIIRDAVANCNGLKSRYERTEVYNNVFYNNTQAFELISEYGQPAREPRRDGDIVNNLIISPSYSTHACRLSHDANTAGEGSFGRYRFVNNTFVSVPSDGNPNNENFMIRVFAGIESVECYNNIFYAPNSGEQFFTTLEFPFTNWANGERQFYGENNWMSSHIQLDPTTDGLFLNTVYGENPGFVDAANGDYTIDEGSIAIGAGVAMADTVHTWDISDWGPSTQGVQYTPIDDSFPNPLLSLAEFGRDDDDEPTLGAFASDYEKPIPPSIDANDGYYVHSAPQSAFYAMVFPFAERLDADNDTSVSFDITVEKAGDGYVSFVPEHWVVTGNWTRMTGISTVGGVFNVRNGDSYVSTGLAYELGRSYKVEFQFDFAAKKYSVYIDDVCVAENYSFLAGSNANRDPENRDYGRPSDNIGMMTVLSMTTANGAEFDVRNINKEMVNLIDKDSLKNLVEENPVDNGDGTYTYLVGPYRAFQKPQDVIPMLQPGDTLALDGGYEYPAPIQILVDYGASHGTVEQPITVKGVPDEDGNLPVIVSYGALRVLQIGAENWVLENLKLQGNTPRIAQIRGIAQSAVRRDWTSYNGIQLDGARNLVIRGCDVSGNYHGIQGGSEGILIEYCDVYNNGLDGEGHNIYLFSSPGSVARVQYNYIHDTTSGSSAGLKSRYSRNEVYYNYFENCGRGFEGIQVNEDDDNGNIPSGRDSDFVGNVIVNCRQNILTGSDDNANGSYGRYHIANNTFINTSATSTVQIVRTVGYLESVEMYNNLVYVSSASANLWSYENAGLDGRWIAGEPRFVGANNWISNIRDVNNIPEGFVNTIRGTDPGFVDLAGGDFMLKRISAAIDAGVPVDTLEVWEDFTEDGVWRGGEFEPMFANPLVDIDKVPVDKNTFEVASRDGMDIPEIGAYAAVEGVPVTFMANDEVHAIAFFDEGGFGILPADPETWNAVFDGWVTADDEAFISTYEVPGAMTVYATWDMNASVSVGGVDRLAIVNGWIAAVFSVQDATGLAALVLEFQVDGSRLSADTWDFGLGGDFETAGSGIKWTQIGDSDVWNGKIELFAPMGSCLDTDEIVDILTVYFQTKSVGKTSIEIVSVLMLDMNGADIASWINVGEAVTDIVYSLYDLNGDGVVDIRDYTMARGFYQADVNSANWAQAQRADLDGNGIVELSDIMAVYFNRTDF